MKLKMVFGLGLFLISFSVFADTYTAISGYSYSGNPPYYSDATEACRQRGLEVWPTGTYTWTAGTPSGTNTPCYRNGSYVFQVQFAKTCPGGGTVSGSNCINAPACGTNQVRSASTGICGMNCTPPESDSGFGTCLVKECTSQQVLNPSTGACQTPPICGSTEAYDPVTNTCHLKTLQCPGHSHANSSNDACLADPPLACPAGQHDNGTYECVADDAQHCSPNQQPGYINGVHQCINKPHLDTLQKAFADAAAAARVAEQDSINAAAAATNANNALAADPTNTGLQNAANQANNNSNAALAKAIDLAANAAQAAADAAIQTGINIDDTLKKTIDGQGNVVGKAAASVFNSALPTDAATQAKSDYNTQFQTISSQVSGMFNFTHSGGGNLPIFDIGTIHGVHVVADLNRYASPLSYVGLTVMFLAAYISVRLFLE